MWETEKLRFPDGATFTEDSLNYFGTQSELLRSDRMRFMTLEQMEKAQPKLISRGDNGEPLDVKIRFFPAPKSSIFTIEASSPIRPIHPPT